MPRKRRVVAPAAPHHIVARGNNRQDIFFEGRDREVYLRLLEKHAKRRGLHIWGYCLMTNHVHVVGVPDKESTLPEVLGGAHSEYTRFINTVYGRCGHLWQARYYSCPMDKWHALQALAYVECNPVRARMVDEAWRYSWSSAAAHCSGRMGAIELSNLEWFSEYSPARWRSVLTSGVASEAFAARLREATRIGFALGSPPFLETLRAQVGRDVERRRAGRPKKAMIVAA